MNKEIELWKEKTKSVFHIIEYKKFWSYIETLQKTNEQYEITYKKIEAQDKIINTQVLEIARLKEKIDKAIEEINYMITNADITEISAIKLKQILGDKENVKN